MMMERRADEAGVVTRIADGIHVIDTGFQGRSGAIAAFLIEGPDGLGLIETGPSTVRARLEAGIANAGHSMEDLTDIVVTHIHLDHSGGLGELMARHGRVHAWAHPLGVPHLVNPERLVKSASRIYGDRMDLLWGTITDVPEDRITATANGETVSLGGRELVVYDTPGHASHHIALFDTQTGTLFTGDVGGVRMPGTPFPLPPMPPPDIDIAAWKRSIALMRELSPDRLVLTHFGAFDDVEAHLNALDQSLDAAMEIGRDVLLNGGTDDYLTERLGVWVHEQVGDDADRIWASLDAANPLYMSAMGIHRVLRKSGELEE